MNDKAKALIDTALIWNWLADNPFSKKMEAPNAASYAMGCPCCEYVCAVNGYASYNGMRNSMCKDDCPMYEAWGNDFCEKRWYDKPSQSPYAGWMYATTTYDKAFFALLIAEWADYLLTNDMEDTMLFSNLQVLTKKQREAQDAAAGMYQVAVGGHAKIKRENERFWVRVISVSENECSGVIDNDLVRTHLHGLKCGSEVIFTIDEVLGVLL